MKSALQIDVPRVVICDNGCFILFCTVCGTVCDSHPQRLHHLANSEVFCFQSLLTLKKFMIDSYESVFVCACVRRLLTVCGTVCDSHQQRSRHLAVA